MLDQIRSAIQLASSVAEIPRQQAERFAKELSKRGELRTSQVSGLAEDIVKRSRDNAEMVRSLITSEIKRQVKALGLATREDLDRLNRRVFGLATKEDLDRLTKRLNEGSSKPAATAKKPTAKPKPAAAKRSSTKGKP
ncbi:MAG: hypothetical protein ABR507_00385 [Actinomycetota bacterium]|nr:hypothetical protein [Actinomycetota bacterium]